jgi:DNA helicase IV
MNSDHARIIADEQAADGRYRAALHDDDQRSQGVTPCGPANAQWTRQNLPRMAALPSGGLVGRVALHHESDIFNGSEFYIGARYLDDKGLTVFSWAAPIASTFFRGRGEHELCGDVAVTRTFLRCKNTIVNFVDDCITEPRLEQAFATRRLIIPKLPSRRPGQTAVATGSSPAVPHAGDSRQVGRSDQGRAAQPGAPAAAQPCKPLNGPALRAERLVHAALTAPRSEKLSSILATIQPDQYDLVTRSSTTPLLIQGHPGTGKTIVAAHRAAYLVHEDTTPEKRRRRRVLIVGPTDFYVWHIKGILTDLAPSGGVRVASLPEIMRELRGMAEQFDESLPADYRDVDAEIGQLAERAARILRVVRKLRSNMKHDAAIAVVYEALRANRVGLWSVTRDREWAAYLKTLPRLAVALKSRRFLPLLAKCSLCVQPQPTEVYDHVIVDEAQDVTPLEWALLDELNASGSWTLLGDMNQRRSDMSYHTWRQIADRLCLGDAETKVEHVQRGYRTTSAIMQFAERLLPQDERRVESLQFDGMPPRIEKVRAIDLPATSAIQALRLVSSYPDGAVAIIGTDRADLVTLLRQRGFSWDLKNRRRWIRGGQAIWVLDAQDARGLEFDAVVVVEPSAFPKRLGRHGLLYTSLTRANRELIIVHSAPLPDELRGYRPAARSSSRRSASSSSIPAQATGQQPAPSRTPTRPSGDTRYVPETASLPVDRRPSRRRPRRTTP